MLTTSLNSDHLFHDFDTLKLQFFPLQKHALHDVDLYTRVSYATMLAANLMIDGKVSEAEHRLFGLLLSSLGLDDSQAYLFEQACALDQTKICDFLRLVKEVRGESCFELDSLVLCRVDGPFSHLRTQFQSELLEFLQIPKSELTSLIFWASKILKLPVEIDVSEEAQQELRINHVVLEEVETKFFGAQPNTWNNHKNATTEVFIKTNDYVEKGQLIASFYLKGTDMTQQRRLRSSHSGLIYEIRINENEEIGYGQVFGAMIPLCPATNAWVEFIKGEKQ